MRKRSLNPGQRGRPRHPIDFKAPIDEDLFKLGELLRQTRKARNLSLDQMAEIAGIHPTGISVAERKGNIQFATAIKLFKALKAELKLTVQLEKDQEPLEVVINL